MGKRYGVNVYLDHLDGELQLSFDCGHYSDQDSCPYCVSDIMPPQEGCRCFLRQDNGVCHSEKAKMDALKKLVSFGKKKLKELEEEERDGYG